LLPKDLQIEKVKAFKITKPRVVGDIALRAFFQLYKKAKQLIKEEQVDFLYIPIPRFMLLCWDSGYIFYDVKVKIMWYN